ncbi:hypothetical protein F2Q70_00042913 [Brassica cretica]|uniref:RRM domain-containing protein n=1 Tax=Brassica cretica TaxID=69181 RepID=A0A8S9KMD7_BRACR|nr:hypothetical protein F2Q70_00042913 [Brassica cretica]
MGTEIMTKLAESYEDICERASPSTAHDALVDAYDTNLMIIGCGGLHRRRLCLYAFRSVIQPLRIFDVCFGSNPDINEKPPMSLRECLEKPKPFIVAYEGIQYQEEWEEDPLLKEIVDHYSGPDRVTKKQNVELDRIATTVPQSAPDTVKRFADRAALSLKRSMKITVEEVRNQKSSFEIGKVILESAILTTVVVLSLTVYTLWAAKGGYDFNFLGHSLLPVSIALSSAQFLPHSIDSSHNLWVGSITMDTTESKVTELFGRFGDIDRITAYSSRGFAFICETSLFLSL